MVGHIASTVRNQRVRNICTQFLRIPMHGILPPTPGLGSPLQLTQSQVHLLGDKSFCQVGINQLGGVAPLY